MAREDGNGADLAMDGVLVRGRVLGWKAASSWKPEGEAGREVEVPAKIGIEFESGDRVEVRTASEDEARAIAATARGEVVTLPVRVSAYGGKIKYRTLTAGGGDSGWQ